MPFATPTIFVVDRDASVRAFLVRLIKSAGWWAETYSSAQEFVARAAAEGPSCLLLDDTLPDLERFALLKRLAANRSAMPIIMIAGHGDVPTTVGAMKAGAIEVLMKPLMGDIVRNAVREAVAESSDRLHREVALQELRARYHSLSARQRDVMLLVVAGLANKQVGGRLGISVITVKAHRGEAMHKMAAGSLAELVTIAITLGLRPFRATGHFRLLQPAHAVA